MIELNILISMLSHHMWDKYSESLDWLSISKQSPEIYKILLSVKQWHTKNTTDLSIDELPLWFYLQYPGIPESKKELYNTIFKSLTVTTIRQELVSQYLQQLKNTQLRRDIAVMAIDDNIPNEKLMGQIEKLSVGQETKIEEEFVTTDIDNLMKMDEDTPGYLWRLSCLNRSIGPIRKGMFGVILARVETGKTALWVSEIAEFCKQIKEDEHICVFFNEENGADVMWRIYSAITGMTAVEIETNSKKAKELFIVGGGQKIKFVDKAQQKPKDIYNTLDKLSPAVIVIDSLDKIKGMDEERRDMQLGKIYQWARETAKIYAPIIGVSQADASCRNKKWLTEMDMADSKTAKPAELDFLIGIGRIDDAGYEYTRFIHIPKNKRRGNKYMNESDRHGKFSTTIQPELSRYIDA